MRNKLVEHVSTRKIEIDWNRDDSIKYKPYDRWVEHWKKDSLNRIAFIGL